MTGKWIVTWLVCGWFNKSRTVFSASVLLLITDDFIKCSKLQVEQRAQRVVSLHSFEHFMASSVINKSTDALKTVRNLFFTTNLNWQAGRALKFEGNCGVKQTKKNMPCYSA